VIRDSVSNFIFALRNPLRALLARIADSSSRNAVNFSSARTMKRFLSPRCASAIQIVRLLESIAQTQPTPTDELSCMLILKASKIAMAAFGLLTALLALAAITENPYKINNQLPLVTEQTTAKPGATAVPKPPQPKPHGPPTKLAVVINVY